MLLVGGKTLAPRCGDTWVYEIRVTRNGQAMSLDGVALTFTAKPDLGDPDAAAVISRSSGAGIDHLTTVGAARLLVPATTTGELEPGVPLWWDVQGVDGGGQPFTPEGLTGRLVPLPQVTRSLS